MRIIVIGAGEVGYHIAERLSHEAHEIVVIERHPEIVRRLEQSLRVRAIAADGSSPRALEAAGVRDAAMVIAVADVDEVNIVACAIAHQFGVATKIARVRDIELGEHPILAGGKVLGIDLLINPTQVVADEILRVIKTTGAAEVADFAGGRVQLLGVKVGARAPLVNRRLRDLRSVQASAPFRIVGIARGESLIVPTDDTTLAAEDHVYVVSRREVIPDILVLMGRTASATRQVFVIGGGRIGLHVARALEAEEITVTVLERTRGRWRPHGEARPSPGSSTATARTSSSWWTRASAGGRGRHPHRRRSHQPPRRAPREAPRREKKAVALFKRQDLIPLVGSLGIDAAISPRLLSTASVILKYVRGGRVVSVFELPESEAETLEVVVQQETPAEGRSIEALGLGADALVGAVVRGDETLTPDADRVLAVGNHVILLALPRAIPAVERLFGL